MKGRVNDLQKQRAWEINVNDVTKVEGKSTEEGKGKTRIIKIVGDSMLNIYRSVKKLLPVSKQFENL